MPSPLHEALLQLFRNRPELAPDLLRGALRADVPDYSEVRIDSAELNEVQPAEYRADMVALLLREEPVMGVVVEVQLSADERKQFVWPAYVVNLRARLRCPVYLLVIAGDESVARWARRPIDLGAGCLFTPWVLNPGSVPEITDEVRAQAEPELAVLSAFAHGDDADVHKTLRIAELACTVSSGLDGGRSKLYFDLVMMSLGATAQREVLLMDRLEDDYESRVERRFMANALAIGRTVGRTEGRIEGRAAVIHRQLTVRFGPLPDSVRARLAAASIGTLNIIAERLLSASTLEEALRSS